MPGKRVNNSSTPKRANLCAALVVCTLILSNTAQSQVPNERLFSETVALKFYNIAHEIIHARDLTKAVESPSTMQQMSSSELNQALLFLFATNQIDSRATYALPEMLSIASRLQTSSQEDTPEISFIPNRLALIIQLLLSYTNSTSDFFVLRETVENVLDQLDSREEREQFIRNLLASGLQGKNKRFDSYLVTKLGLYSAEKTDLQGAATFLIEAYNLDNFNHLAFSKLTEIVPDQIQPQMYLKQLRLKLVENPLDLAVCLDFAHFSESLELYDIASEAYTYCADLFTYLYPSETLPSSIYLPLVLSYYNTERNHYKAVQIAEGIRGSGRFDLILEAIASKAAEKSGDTQTAQQLLQTAQETALTEYMQNPNQIMAEQLSWFYSFVDIKPMKAIDWANKAFSNDPNSASAASLLAYNLAQNGEADLVQNIVDNYPSNQIIDLTLAKIAIKQGNTESSIEYLNSAIKKDPASFEADIAKNIL
ncbi:MAG: tetratricopeptide repeat protein, partial [Planctomycetota bacterium]